MTRKQTLLCQIRSLHFAILETGMFLDTHPCDREALDMLEVYRRKYEKCVALYEAEFGCLITTADDVSGNCWAWLNSPWPWEPERGE